MHIHAVGGLARSKPMAGAVVDIATASRDPVAFEQAAREVGSLGFGSYPRSDFCN